MLKVFILIPRAKLLRVFSWVGTERQLGYMIRLAMRMLLSKSRRKIMVTNSSKEGKRKDISDTEMTMIGFGDDRLGNRKVEETLADIY